MLISLPQGPILLRLRERRVGACLRLPAVAGACRRMGQQQLKLARCSHSLASTLDRDVFYLGNPFPRFLDSWFESLAVASHPLQPD